MTGKEHDCGDPSCEGCCDPGMKDRIMKCLNNIPSEGLAKITATITKVDPEMNKKLEKTKQDLIEKDELKEDDNPFKSEAFMLDFFENVSELSTEIKTKIFTVVKDYNPDCEVADGILSC
jgi:hypothetical protein